MIVADVDPELMAHLRAKIFRSGEAGTRCLLDEPVVCAAALSLKRSLVAAGILPNAAVAVQAIAFDKTTATNWKVTWHQDLLFPFHCAVTSPDYHLACVKDGVDFARPPQSVLEELLAVRLHLDDCNETNGPLRVAPGSHRVGIIPSAEIATQVSRFGEVTCEAAAGTGLLMRPLLLHASSRAMLPLHRRVLHVVFHTGSPVAERWHRAVGLPNQAPELKITDIKSQTGQKVLPDSSD